MHTLANRKGRVWRVQPRVVLKSQMRHIPNQCRACLLQAEQKAANSVAC